MEQKNGSSKWKTGDGIECQLKLILFQLFQTVRFIVELIGNFSLYIIRMIHKLCPTRVLNNARDIRSDHTYFLHDVSDGLIIASKLRRSYLKRLHV